MHGQINYYFLRGTKMKVLFLLIGSLLTISPAMAKVLVCTQDQRPVDGNLKVVKITPVGRSLRANVEITTTTAGMTGHPVTKKESIPFQVCRMRYIPTHDIDDNRLLFQGGSCKTKTGISRAKLTISRGTSGFKIVLSRAFARSVWRHKLLGNRFRCK